MQMSYEHVMPGNNREHRNSSLQLDPWQVPHEQLHQSCLKLRERKLITNTECEVLKCSQSS